MVLVLNYDEGLCKKRYLGSESSTYVVEQIIFNSLRARAMAKVSG
jgi:hypothetical protein